MLDREHRKNQEQGGGAGHRTELDCLLFQLFLNSCATDIVLVTAPHSNFSNCGDTLVAAKWRGPNRLNIVVLAVVHGLLGPSGARGRATSHSLSPPPTPIPFRVPNISLLWA